MDVINESDSLRESVSPEGRSVRVRACVCVCLPVCVCVCECVSASVCRACQRAIASSGYSGPDDILLRIHGDEGPYFKKRNLLVMSLSFPHNHGVPRLQNQLQHRHENMVLPLISITLVQRHDDDPPSDVQLAY